MRTIIRSFFGIKVANPWVLIGGLVLASLAEGIGLAGLLPLFTVAVGDQGEESPAFRWSSRASSPWG